MSCVTFLVVLTEFHMSQFRICCPKNSELMTVKSVLYLGKLMQICNQSSLQMRSKEGIKSWPHPFICACKSERVFSPTLQLQSVANLWWNGDILPISITPGKYLPLIVALCFNEQINGLSTILDKKPQLLKQSTSSPSVTWANWLIGWS